MKLIAVRSAMSRLAAEPSTRSATLPRSMKSPSRSANSTCSDGSTRRKTAAATSTPQSTPGCFAKSVAVACRSSGTNAAVVASPIPRSSCNARSIRSWISGVNSIGYTVNFIRSWPKVNVPL